MRGLALIAAVLNRIGYELGRYRRQVQQQRTKEQTDAIVEDPTAAHAKRFGTAAGRVSVQPDDPKP